MKVNLVVAAADNGVIGRDGALPWRIPADLRHFKEVTMGHPIVMGRKTWESLGRALPGRTNIVITRDPAYNADGASVAGSFEDALDAAGKAEGGENVMIIGGAEIYRLAMSRADRIYLTEVHEATEGDTLFPALDHRMWQETSREAFAKAGDTPAFSFVTFDRQQEG